MQKKKKKKKNHAHRFIQIEGQKKICSFSSTNKNKKHTNHCSPVKNKECIITPCNIFLVLLIIIKKFQIYI